MTKRRQKLELTWIGKDKRPKLEPRILIENPEKSYHAQKKVSENDIFDNELIFGDNLLALKALEHEFTGEVKCIYIDPPYNSGKAFEYYDDGVEHSIWLSLMRDRLEVMWKLLRNDGFICCHIDDSEGHYLKVLMDEVFGRCNYLATLYIQVRYAEKTLKQDMDFHKQIEQVHIYRKEYGAKPILPTQEKTFEKFKYYFDELGAGEEIVLGGKKVIRFKKGEYRIIEGESSGNGLKEIWASGTILDGNSSGRFFRDYLTGRSEIDGLGAMYKVYGIGDDQFDYRYFTGPKRAGATKGKYYQGVPVAQLETDSADKTSPIENFFNLAGSFGNCRHEGGVEFRSGKKPEKLIEIVLRHFSSAGDLVLDSFAGSGTVGAVAHKMGRRWIMVELGEHCHTHVIPRMTAVIDGEDHSGISKGVHWGGGGGFRYYKVGPSLIVEDAWGNPIINREFKAEMLAEAMCKIEGFEYIPSEDTYWIHGKSTERDFIYVTTQFMSKDMLTKISDEVGPDRSLLICCSAFRCNPNQFSNLTLKKIPKAVLSKCEWGHDDYSLEIKNLPEAPAITETEDGGTRASTKTKHRRFGKDKDRQVELFDMGDK